MKPQLVQIVTGSRIGLAAVVAVLVTSAGESVAVLWVCLFLMAFIEISDLVDGWLARRWRTVTDFGKMFDPYADAVSRLIVYWALSRIGLCYAMVPLVLAARDVTVAYIRATLTEAGRDVSARWLGKTKAVVHGVTALVLLFTRLVLPGVAPYLVAPASILVMVLSVAAGVDHLISAWPAITAKFRALR